MSTPAGWYPQPDGQQRYWDGEQWTENFAPGGTPVAASVVANSAVGATDKAARPWFKKKRFVLPGIAVAIIVAANLGGGGTDSTNVAAVDSSTAAPAAVQCRSSMPITR